MQFLPSTPLPLQQENIRTVLEEIRQRAEDRFPEKEYFCSGAVFYTLNEVFEGGLEKETAVSMAAGFPQGMGGSGCTCGALTGAVMGAGLLLGQKADQGGAGQGRGGKEIRKVSALIHNRFKSEFHSTCCRALTRKVKENGRAHQNQCRMLTGAGAVLAASVLVERDPQLLIRAQRILQTAPPVESRRFIGRLVSPILSFFRS